MLGKSMVSTNAIVNKTDTVPVFSGYGGGTIITNCEYIGPIFSGPTITNGSTNFDINTYQINPADEGTFPWLAKLAQNFSEHRWHGLAFEYKSLSGNALSSTNTALGKVIMATQYNVYEKTFPNAQWMENSAYANAAKPSQNQVHAIECNEFLNPTKILYCNDSDNFDDKRFENIGKMSIATQGCQQINVLLGELWATYKVELLKPRQNDSGDLGAIWSFADNKAIGAAAAIGQNDTNWLGLASGYRSQFRSADLIPSNGWLASSNFDGIMIERITTGSGPTSMITFPNTFSGDVVILTESLYTTQGFHLPPVLIVDPTYTNGKIEPLLSGIGGVNSNYHAPTPYGTNVTNNYTFRTTTIATFRSTGGGRVMYDAGPNGVNVQGDNVAGMAATTELKVYIMTLPNIFPATNPN